MAHRNRGGGTPRGRNRTDGAAATGSDPVVELQERVARSRAANGRAKGQRGSSTKVTRGAKSLPRAAGQQGSSLERESRREQSTRRLASLAQYGPRRAVNTICSDPMLLRRVKQEAGEERDREQREEAQA